MELAKNEKATATLVPDGELASVPEWTSSDPGVANPIPSPDGESATVVAGRVGTVRVTVAFDVVVNPEKPKPAPSIETGAPEDK